MSNPTELNGPQIFRVERNCAERRGWAVMQSGVQVAAFATREAAVDAAHTLAASNWRIRQTASRVVVVGEDGRLEAIRMFGDTSRRAPTAGDDAGGIVMSDPHVFPVQAC